MAAARRQRPRRPQTVAEVMRGGRGQLTPAELRVAQTLLADYPAAGLQSVAALAERAGVSGPTVVRLVAKLGFAGYAELQSRLRAELSARNAGPVQRYPSADGARQASPLLRRFERSVSAAVSESLVSIDAVEFDAAVSLLVDPHRPVRITGGRVSSVHALYLARSLALLRPDVRFVEAERAVRAATLLDVGPESVVVVFDYRRYDDEVIEFGRGVATAGASVVLMTDTYLSPLAASATVLLTSSVEGPAPFITLTPALAIVEALVLGAVERTGSPLRRRLERFDTLNADLSSP
ncbi:MAG TPA: MurR/RpiR family transcriptional regulator [Jatrophihabitantaceae bacterium]|jgi:DNA-binding MurR/RpiR family transcriptional regulator|nr:MurR/RpiR family transcriptional regulator [Jatrophihabitantaceae bacterium]